MIRTWTRLDRLRFLALLLFAATASGCGAAASSAPPPAMATTEPPQATQDIHMLESSIEQQMGIMSAGGECLDRCRAASSICDSSERICVIAQDLAEHAAIESCRQSEGHCTEARRVVEEGCTCPEE